MCRRGYERAYASTNPLPQDGTDLWSARSPYAHHSSSSSQPSALLYHPKSRHRKLQISRNPEPEAKGDRLETMAGNCAAVGCGCIIENHPIELNNMRISRFIFPARVFHVSLAFVTLLIIATSGGAQQPGPQPAATRFDVTHYRIEAQLIPDQHMLRAGADITVIPQESTRSLVF